MKKFFAVLLTGLMAISIAACSNSNQGKTELAQITKTDSTKEDYLTDTKLYKSFYSKVNDDEFNIKTIIEQISKFADKIKMSIYVFDNFL